MSEDRDRLVTVALSEDEVLTLQVEPPDDDGNTSETVTVMRVTKARMRAARMPCARLVEWIQDNTGTDLQNSTHELWCVLAPLIAEHGASIRETDGRAVLPWMSMGKLVHFTLEADFVDEGKTPSFVWSSLIKQGLEDLKARREKVKLAEEEAKRREHDLLVLRYRKWVKANPLCISGHVPPEFQGILVPPSLDRGTQKLVPRV
jgi:hypothetical protein